MAHIQSYCMCAAHYFNLALLRQQANSPGKIFVPCDYPDYYPGLYRAAILSAVVSVEEGLYIDRIYYFPGGNGGICGHSNYFGFLPGNCVTASRVIIQNPSSKGGRRPQPKKVLRTILRRTDLCAEASRNFLSTEEKIVFLAIFFNPLIKGGWHPQPKKVLRTILRRTDLCAEASRNFLSTEEKIVFLAIFFNPLIKVKICKSRRTRRKRSTPGP